MTSEDYNDCVRQNADGLYRFVARQLRNDADAEDIVQASFEKLWNKKDRVEAERAKAYLFAIAHNTMIDWLRRNKFVYSSDQLPSLGTSRESDSFELREIVDRALDALSTQQREIVLLRDYEGYSYQEIGEIMQLTESQVKVYIFRARKKMQEIITLENSLRPF